MATITMYNNINVDDAFSPLFECVSTGGTVAQSGSDPTTTWTARTLPSSSAWNSICYGNGIIVAVAGTTNVAASTPDGITWTARTMSASATWKSVAFGNNRFVAVASGSTDSAYSEDGVTWTAGGALPSGAAWSSIAYGMIGTTPTFVVVSSGSSTAAAYSTDGGSTWNSATLPSGDWRSVCFGNGKFVTVSYNSNTAATSTNGTSWSSQTMYSTNNWSSICYGNGKYVALAYGSNVSTYSTDGITWADSVMPSSANWNAVCYGISSVQGVSIYMAVCYGATTGAYSYDGIIWASRTVATSANYTSIAFCPITWNSGDTLVITNNATITVNTNQTKFWKTITGTYGKLLIQNTSSTDAINFYMGRVTSNTANPITPGSGLFSIDIQGNWIYLTPGTGAASITRTIPYTEYVPFVEVETEAGSDVYRMWINIKGAYGPYMRLFGGGGFAMVSTDDRGRYFRQEAKTNPCVIYTLTSGETRVRSNRVLCADTTGILPGASITGTNIPASSVVNRVINSTTLELNTFPTVAGTGITFTCFNPVQDQFTTTITFGDGTNGDIVPNGAKIRIPNIMFSDATPANLMTASNLVQGNITMATSSPISAQICMFGQAYVSIAQASAVYFRHVGFAYKFALSECYNVDIDYLATAPTPTYWYYTTKWIIRDQRYAISNPGGYTAPTGSCVTVMSYISGAKISNWHDCVYSSGYFTGNSPTNQVDVSYSDDMVWSDVKLIQLNLRRNNYCLALSNRCYRNTFTNLKLYGANPLLMSTSDDNIFNNIQYSLFMFRPNQSFLTLQRIYADPTDNWNTMVDNTKYYIKTRTYYSWVDIDGPNYYDSNEYSCTPFEGEWQFPDTLSVRPTESAANSVTIDWVRRAPESGTILYEIYRDTTEGFTLRHTSNRIYGSATAATVTYADTGVTAGTRYYYRFRKYNYLQALGNCSASNGSTTLTTTNNFSLLHAITDCSFVAGSTTVYNIVNSFYALMLAPGYTITGTGIDDGTTIESIGLCGRTLHLSKPTLSTQNLVTLYLPAQVGMGLNNANIPYGTVIQSVESTTSLTMSNATTGAITNATVNFQDFGESPEFTCVPNAYASSTNYATYSKDFSNAAWAKSNITVSVNTYQSPSDPTWGTNTLDQLTATADNGTATLTVTGLTASTAYTASFQVRADQTATDPNGVSGTFSFGTTTTAFTANNSLERYDATFTTTGTSADVVIKINTNGKVIHCGDVMVALGSSARAHINTTASPVTLAPCAQQLSRIDAVCRNRKFTGKPGNQGIRLTLPAAPTGAYFSEIHVSRTPGFTPDNSTYVATTYSMANYHFSLTGCSRNTFTDINKQFGGGSTGTSIFYVITSSLDNKFINCNIDLEYCNAIATGSINIGASSHRNLFHNIDFGKIRNYEVGSSLIYTQLTNSITGNRFQNIRTELYDIAMSNQSLNAITKGVAGCNAGPATTATTFAFGGTSDGIASAYTASYGTMFYELYQGTNLGALHLVMEDTLGTSKPYTILSGTPTFTNTGNLFMPNAGDSIEITWPNKIYGVSGFWKRIPKMLGVDLGNIADQLDGLKIEYAIKTTGDYGAYKRLVVDNLTSETVSASDGFNIKFKFTAMQFMKYGAQTNPFVVGETIRGATSGATAYVLENYDNGATGTIIVNNVTGLFIPAESLVRDSDSEARAPNVATNGFALGPSYTSYISALQVFTTVDQTVLYPVSTPTIKLTGLQPHSEVRVYDNSMNEITGIEDTGTATEWSATYDYFSDVTGYIVVIALNYQVLRIEDLTFGIDGLEIPVQQILDRQYYNPA